MEYPSSPLYFLGKRAVFLTILHHVVENTVTRTINVCTMGRLAYYCRVWFNVFSVLWLAIFGIIIDNFQWLLISGMESQDEERIPFAGTTTVKYPFVKMIYCLLLWFIK